MCTKINKKADGHRDCRLFLLRKGVAGNPATSQGKCVGVRNWKRRPTFFEMAKAMAKKGYAQISKLKINRDFGLSKISNLKSQISNL